MTLFPQDGRDAEVLMKNADLALSRAKQEGAGACVLYRHELHLRAIERNQIERDLRAAVARQELKLYYQPKVDVATGQITGAEALIRWPHEERGFIPPSVFIPVAERSGLVVDLTRWVLDEACRQNRQWQDDGLPRITVAVNVSAIDLRRADLTDTIANTLIARGLSPQYLELEVTESMVMEDVDTVIGTLRRLRSLGIGIGIDDFGTGYSSLAYLKRFPVKRLKIDRSFVNDIADGREGHIIPKVIIDLAHALGVSVVARASKAPTSSTSCASSAATRCRAISWAGRCRPPSSRSFCATRRPARGASPLPATPPESHLPFPLTQRAPCARRRRLRARRALHSRVAPPTMSAGARRPQAPRRETSFMDLAYGPEYEAFRAEVRAFIAKHGAKAPRRFGVSRPSEETQNWQRLLIEHGLTARTIPKEYGGYGAEPDILKSRIIAEEFTAAGLPMGIANQGISMLVPTLLELGTEEQKKKWIAPTLRGEVVWCQGYSEPGSGSDLASLQTKAVEDGDDFIINGQKIWTRPRMRPT